MPSRPTAFVRRSRAWLIGLGLTFASGFALSAPFDAADPVLKLLADKGIVVSPSTPVHAAEDESPEASSGLLHRVQQHASAMVVGAMNFLGVRYLRGGNSAETGFDCSGFTRHVFEMSLGLVLPRRTDEQAVAPGFVAVKREDLRPGDLVFFNTLKHTFSHVGIYIGENRFIHAPRTGQVVRTEDMSFAYWAKRFTGARRAEAVFDAPLKAQTAASSVGS